MYFLLASKQVSNRHLRGPRNMSRSLCPTHSLEWRTRSRGGYKTKEFMAQMLETCRVLACPLARRREAHGILEEEAVVFLVAIPTVVYLVEFLLTEAMAVDLPEILEVLEVVLLALVLLVATLLEVAFMQLNCQCQPT